MFKQLVFAKIKIGAATLEKKSPLVLISGPCVLESEGHALLCAEKLCQVCDAFDVQLIYKASYDKANRSSIASFRGVGIERGLRILQKVKETFSLPVTTDIHHPEEAAAAAQVCDVLQIPAFLCRQTDLLTCAGKTQRPINIKKGQFLAPWDMQHAIEKVRATGNEQVIVTERGACFGYNNLITDMRSIPIMQKWGVPICFDASHSVQLPGGKGKQSGGQREFLLPLARAAIAAGADLLFVETHPDPDRAKSDAASVLAIDQLGAFLARILPLFDLVRKE